MTIYYAKARILLRTEDRTERTHSTGRGSIHHSKRLPSFLSGGFSVFPGAVVCPAVHYTY